MQRQWLAIGAVALLVVLAGCSGGGGGDGGDGGADWCTENRVPTSQLGQVDDHEASVTVRGLVDREDVDQQVCRVDYEYANPQEIGAANAEVYFTQDGSGFEMIVYDPNGNQFQTVGNLGSSSGGMTDGATGASTGGSSSGGTDPGGSGEASVEGSISYGQTVQGELTTDDGTTEFRDAFADGYTFEGSDGDRVTITMFSQPPEASTSPDVYLLLEKPDGLVSEENNDDPTLEGSLNSRIQTTLQSDGTYTIWAMSGPETRYSEAATGPYTLTLEGS